MNEQKPVTRVKGIGFRVEKNAVYWSVVTGTKEIPILLEHRKLNAPGIYRSDEAARLNWFRGQISDVLEDHQPRMAFVRYPETISPGKPTNGSRERCRIEGVILQLLYEKRIAILTGSITTLQASIASESVKDDLDSEEFRGLDWSKYIDNARESIIAAVAALES